MDDCTRQAEEMEVLSSIYGNDWKIKSRGEREHTIDITQDKITITLCFTIPENYPSISQPICELSAPLLNNIEKEKLYDALNDVCSNNVGETVIYQCIEKIRETLQLFMPDPVYLEKSEPTILNSNMNIDNPVCENCPKITHGDIIEDRKSIFQGHVAVITSENDVNVVFHTLKKIRKISEATHNILAWKFNNHKDYDDDGEKSAGSKLLHLLDLLNLNNIVVVVSRWYGGTHLGPIRFRHINNAARMAIIKAGLKAQ